MLRPLWFSMNMSVPCLYCSLCLDLVPRCVRSRGGGSGGRSEGGEEHCPAIVAPPG